MATGEIVATLLSAVERDGAIPKTAITKQASRAQVLEVFDALVRARARDRRALRSAPTRSAATGAIGQRPALAEGAGRGAR
jgi:hypothetical protein